MTWHSLDAQRKTWVFLSVVGVIVLLILWPDPPPRPRRMPARSPAKQVPVSRAPQLTHAKVAPPPDPLQDLLGNFQGREVLPGGRGACGVHLEIVRDKAAAKGAKDSFTAYSRMGCQPLLRALILEHKLTRAQALEVMQQASNPTAAVLAGSAVGGSLHLVAQNNVGVRDAWHGCEITTLSVAPGGTNTINVEWQETSEPTGVCRGAQMQMHKVAR